MLPKLSFIARLTRDSETRYTNNGDPVTTVGLACSEKYGERETTLFIDGTAFKKTAEMIARVQKGQRVFVFGKLKTDQWEDNQTGQKRSKINMIIESIEFIEQKQDSQSNQPHGGYDQGYQQPAQPKGSQGYNQCQGGFNLDYIPFWNS